MVDLTHTSLDGYESVKQLLKGGACIPIIYIGDKKFFTGKVSHLLIYEAIKEILES